MGSQAEWYGKWKCIHAHIFIFPSSLCLLVGAFSPFTVKAVFHMYDPITIFFIFLDFFCVNTFLLLCFLPREIILAFVVNLVCWCWILLTFACLENFWFLHQIWMRVLLGRVFLVVGSYVMPFPSGLWSFCWESAHSLMGFPCIFFVLFPFMLLILYICL